MFKNKILLKGTNGAAVNGSHPETGSFKLTIETR